MPEGFDTRLTVSYQGEDGTYVTDDDAQIKLKRLFIPSTDPSYEVLKKRVTRLVTHRNQGR